MFSYAELEEATKSFDPSMEIGDGGFGTVYYGKKIISPVYLPVSHTYMASCF